MGARASGLYRIFAQIGGDVSGLAKVARTEEVDRGINLRLIEIYPLPGCDDIEDSVFAQTLREQVGLGKITLVY